MQADERKSAARYTARADFVNYIYDTLCDATKAFLAHEWQAQRADPDGRYVTFSDAFTAQYLGDRLADVTVSLEERLDTLKRIMLESDATFELIGKVQLWACGLWGAMAAQRVGHEAEITALKNRP